MLVATAPLLLMSLVVSIAFYISGKDEVAQTLQERGHLIAAALSETSQYAVVSGNISYLERNIKQLLKTNNSIAAIEILDSTRKPVAAVGIFSSNNAAVFEMPIGSEIPDVDLFEETGSPHAPFDLAGQKTFRSRPPTGFVRVVMSEIPILAEKQRRLYLGAGVVLLATIFSGVTGLYLAQKLRAPLGAAMTALREIRQGRFSVSLNDDASGELGELHTTILAMAQGLSTSRRELEVQVAERTSALQEAMNAVSAADTEKRRLIARGNDLVEEERHRIAVEIHDHLNASLLVVNMKAQHIASITSQPLADDDVSEVEKTAHDISATVQELYSAARAIVKRLRPEVIDTLGLKGAIAEMVRSYDELHPACYFSLEVGDSFPELRGQPAITAYRLVQEALSNAVKHASAKNVKVFLGLHTKLNLMIQVSDDGTGFDPSKRSENSFGLIGMRERVNSSAGSMTVFSKQNQGTRVTFILPRV